MKSVAYFDMNRTILKRYPLLIAQQVQELSPDTATHFIYDDECKTSEEELLKEIGFLVTLHKARFPSQRAVESLFESVRPDLLVVTAQRLPDTVHVAHAKEVGIPSVMFQHGLYIPFMKRTWSLFA